MSSNSNDDGDEFFELHQKDLVWLFSRNGLDKIPREQLPVGSQYKTSHDGYEIYETQDKRLEDLFDG